jgi:hypothetical protein
VEIDGVYLKSVQVATIFGLPMLKVNLPGKTTEPLPLSDVEATAAVASGIGQTLGLSTADLTISPTLTANLQEMTLEDGSGVTETVYFSGGAGVVARPGEPILPVEVANITNEAGVPRGAGFRGGAYTDLPDVIAHTSVVATELPGGHPVFNTPDFYPFQLARINYVDYLAESGAGIVKLMATPAQYRSNSIESLDGTMRLYDSLTYRLYYLPYSDETSSSAVVGPPAVARVFAQDTSGVIAFQIEVVGLIQEVWITYTSEEGDWYGQWQPLDLAVDPSVNQTLWLGELTRPGNVPLESVRFMVHAAGANGLVTGSGEVFELPMIEGGGEPSVVTIIDGPAGGVYAGTAAFTAELRDSGGNALPNLPIVFGLSTQKRAALTNAQGQATATFLLLENPANYSEVQAAFPGSPGSASSPGYQASPAASQPFTVSKRPTVLSLAPDPLEVYLVQGVSMVATLADDQGRALREKSVLLTVSQGSTTLFAKSQITNYGGQVGLNLSELPNPVAGDYTVAAYFASSPVAGVVLADPNYGPSSDEALLKILNTPPTVAADNGSVTVDEGQTITNTGTYGDANGDDVTLSASIGTVIAGSGTWEWSYLAPDGPAELSVTISATDAPGAVTTTTFSLTVNNVAPVIGTITAPLEPVQLKANGAQISVSADFTDPGVLDTHTATWDWGDGTTSAGTVTEVNGSGSVAGAHTYTAVGVYVLKLTVTDKDGGEDSQEYRYVVVYDPDGGYVTGVGWINSPAGAYTADPTLTGTANFGLNAKYAKGATVPDGQTQFQFQAGSLNFHSESYEWLVVSGAKAQFKGIGTINGAGSYKFILTAIDGDVNTSDAFEVDRLRIKIWYEDGEGVHVVYDNGLGADDTDDNATTALGSGAITVHEGSKGGGKK